MENIIVPLGISFYTFQQISCVTDVYRGEIGDIKLVDYVTYSLFFPTISSGPILYYKEFAVWAGNNESYCVNYKNICAGFQLFCFGLAKKVLVADTLAKAVNKGYELLDGFGTTNAILLALCYSFQLYFDFTGYCDMSFGVAKMLNFNLPINFDSPYKAINIAEFWDRWHISLTRFFTKYVYIPLGGSRKGIIRTYVNILIVFFISGIWHGNEKRFIIWGMLHGFAMVAYRIFKRIIDKWHPAFNWFITFSFVTTAWIYFGAPTIEKAHTLIKKLLLLDFDSVDKHFAAEFNTLAITKLFEVFKLDINEIFPYQVMVIALFIMIFVVLCCKNNIQKCMEMKFNPVKSVAAAVLLVCSICGMTDTITFVYSMF